MSWWRRSGKSGSGKSKPTKPLVEEAQRLADALAKILDGIRTYHTTNQAPSDGARKHLERWIAQLTPASRALQAIVTSHGSRVEAQEILNDIGPTIEKICGASKGTDLHDTFDGALNAYLELETIFRETRYRDELLWHSCALPTQSAGRHRRADSIMR